MGTVGAGYKAMSELAQSLPWGRDEVELVTELQAGSDAAFDHLVTHYHANVYNLVYGILGDSADAADVTQEVFLCAFRGIRGFRRGSSLKTWLYRISVRQALNHRRWCWRHHRMQTSIDTEDAGKLPLLELRDAEATPFEQLAAQEVQRTVRRALAAVPALFRSAVILRDLEGLSYEEIAEVLDVSVGTVKSRILRGRRLLKDILNPLLRATPQREAPETRMSPIPVQAPPATADADSNSGPHPETRRMPGAMAAAAAEDTRSRPAMNCHEAQDRLSGYLDGAIRGQEHADLREHLNSCGECRQQLDCYQLLATYMSCVERVPPPTVLALRIRMDASRANSLWARTTQLWTRAWLAFHNILQPLAVPATGGVLTALAVFVLVVQNILVGVPLGGVVPNDLPLNLVEPARLESLAPFPVPGSASTDTRPGSSALLLEATLNAQGQVVFYKILSGPEDTVVQHQIDQLLLFSHFRPQISFGRPMGGGTVLLNFSEVRVRG